MRAIRQVELIERLDVDALGRIHVQVQVRVADIRDHAARAVTVDERAERFIAAEAAVDDVGRAEPRDGAVDLDFPPVDRQPEPLAPRPLRREHESVRLGIALFGRDIDVAGIRDQRPDRWRQSMG